MIGNYKFKSPYHKNKELPFNVEYKSYDGKYKIYTEEYKGWKCYPIDAYYKAEDIKEMITKGIIYK